jgi:hypothetical protein
MLQVSDEVVARRTRLAERMTEIIEADRRVGRCKRIDFSVEGGAQLTVELVTGSDATSRHSIARELEFAITQAFPALLWARVQVG